MIEFLFWPAVLLILILVFGSRGASSSQKPRLMPADGLFGVHLTGVSAFIIVFLVVALTALAERALYDLGHAFAGGDSFSYWDNLSVIVVHALFVIPVLIVSIVVNVAVGSKAQRYALVLIPYFVTSVILAIQLVLQLSVYFYNHHTDLQFYLVMLALIGVGSYAIYFIQNLYNQKLQEMRHS